MPGCLSPAGIGPGEEAAVSRAWLCQNGLRRAREPTASSLVPIPAGEDNRSRGKRAQAELGGRWEEERERVSALAPPPLQQGRGSNHKDHPGPIESIDFALGTKIFLDSLDWLLCPRTVAEARTGGWRRRLMLGRGGNHPLITRNLRPSLMIS